MKISILGCGWLGLELGKKLARENHEVRGSVTRNEKMAELRQAGIIPYTIKIFEKGVQGDLRSFLSTSQILIIDIPPGLRKNPEANFVQKIRSLIPSIERARPKKVIFVSSTSVYADTEDFPVYTEDSDTDNTDDSAVQLRNAELLFLNNEKLPATVLRFGGLIGEDRHPIHYLSGRKDVSNPKAPVNLVHREDCIATILKLIQNEKDQGVWNVVFPEHPPKEEYYTKAAKEMNLEIPVFDHSVKSKGKIVSSEKLLKTIKFSQPLL